MLYHGILLILYYIPTTGPKCPQIDEASGCSKRPGAGMTWLGRSRGCPEAAALNTHTARTKVLTQFAPTLAETAEETLVDLLCAPRAAEKIVCVYIYIYIYIHTHIHIHTYILSYIICSIKSRRAHSSDSPDLNVLNVLVLPLHAVVVKPARCAISHRVASRRIVWRGGASQRHRNGIAHTHTHTHIHTHTHTSHTSHRRIPQARAQGCESCR